MALKVEVVQALPRKARVVVVELPEGATVTDALAKAKVKGEAVGIFGETASLDRKLAHGDRVEVYRALKLDPKEARRQRAARRR